MHKLISGLLVGLVFLSGQSSADKPQRETATLVDVRIAPPCYGLDCPPLPMPFDVYLCFQVKDTYYAAMYRPWGFPWAPPRKGLIALRGQSVEVTVTDKRIGVVAPLSVNLKRVHNYGLFGLASCNQA